MPADPARVATARQLIAQLGVTLADLQEDLDLRPDTATTPTVAEYLPQVLAAAGSGARPCLPQRRPNKCKQQKTFRV